MNRLRFWRIAAPGRNAAWSVPGLRLTPTGLEDCIRKRLMCATNPETPSGGPNVAEGAPERIGFAQERVCGWREADKALRPVAAAMGHCRSGVAVRHF